MKYFSFLFIFIFVSCSQVTNRREPLILPEINPVALRPVEFVILRKDSCTSIFSELEVNGQQPIVIGLSFEDYKKLSMNISDLRRYIILQKQQLHACKIYYEGD